MKSITITQLNYIVEVARAGHFGSAAKNCFVTQPTLSMQIQKLEGDLGVVLFDRSKKPVEPTPMGHKIIAVARGILHGLESIDEVIQGERGEIQGEFKLAAIPTLAPYLLPRFLHHFLEKHPKLELTVEELETEEILRRIRESRIDVGLLAIPLKAKGIVEKPIFKDPFVCYLSEDHPLQKYEKISEQQLIDKDFWLLTEGHCFREQVIDLCRFRKRKIARQHIHFESGNLETLKKLVERKYGYTLLPYLAVLEIPDKEREKRVKYFSEPVPTREVGLAYSESFVKFRALEALKNAIELSLPNELKNIGQKKKFALFPYLSSPENL